ncbi:DUF2306 domain-containing protein [Vibrio amylolyticus]|uniref:DUF2306 domain-containing protein n=1 Tax=Vibrio amylolyticus TaxID=2847292 RepID=UPI0035504693
MKYMYPIAWFSMFVLATLISSYGIAMLVIPGIAPESFQARLSSGDTFLYGHVIFGVIALFIGAFQMSGRFRGLSLKMHRNIGKLYLVSVSIAAILGFELALRAEGGIWAQSGFASLSIAWIVTGYMAYIRARSGNIVSHKIWITYNYALTYAGVTLRIYLGIAMGMLDIDFMLAYAVIAWLCWVPNLFVVYAVMQWKNQQTVQDFKHGIQVAMTNKSI